jgi:NAD+ synthase (glutamine-hydrolysing)
MVSWFVESLLSNTEFLEGFSNNNVFLASILEEVLNTPVSPELLPPDENDDITQKTEDKVGPYILHDFFIYHFLHSNAGPKKLLAIAKEAFADEYDEDFIKKWLKVFYNRFFIHQFKRSCTPDSPKIGTVSLSARGDWQMPTDADSAVWLLDLDL